MSAVLMWQHVYCRSRPALENGLDWVLALYKVLWPVLVRLLF